MAFGGLPISVPSPPIEADHPTASTRQMPKRAMSGSETASATVAPCSMARLCARATSLPRLRSVTSASTEVAMGSIISAVAVFETHIDRNPVASIIPSTIRRGDSPTRRSVSSAMRRCRFHFSIAMAIRKPPRNRNTTELAKGCVVCATVRSVSTGIRTTGNSEVTDSGIASVIHQTAISAMTLATFRASGGRSGCDPSPRYTPAATTSPSARSAQIVPARRPTGGP